MCCPPFDDVGVLYGAYITRTSCRPSLSPPCHHQAFRELLATPTLPLDAGYSCVLTVVRILSGAGRVLDVDDEAFKAYLLASLPRLAFPGCDKHVPAALDCVDALLLRKRELAMERVGVFIKQLVSIAPHVAVHYSLAIMSLVRSLLVRYPGHQQVGFAHVVPPPPPVRPCIAITNAGVGGNWLRRGVFLCASWPPLPFPTAGCFGCALPFNGLQLLDRESDRAVSSSTDTLWELEALGRSFHPALADFSLGTIGMVPLAPSQAPRDLLFAFDASKALAFNPPMKPPPIDGARRRAFLKQRGQQGAGAGAGGRTPPVQVAPKQ